MIPDAKIRPLAGTAWDVDDFSKGRFYIGNQAQGGLVVFDPATEAFTFVDPPGGGIDIASAIGGPATTIRTDGTAPVVVIETEGDVVGLLSYLPARQPDTDRFRLWEIAGAAHADKLQVGDAEDMLGCAAPINRGQQVFVLRAALRHLDTWVADGTAPPEAPRLDVDESGDAPVFEVDEVGNVTGGIRTPAVDAPVDVLSGANDDESIICVLFGSTTPIPAAELTQLYDGPEDYLDAYEQATDEMIELGFALEDDREALLDDADPGRLAG